MYSSHFPIGVGGLLRLRRVEIMCSDLGDPAALDLEANGEKARTSRCRIAVNIPDRSHAPDRRGSARGPTSCVTVSQVPSGNGISTLFSV